MWDMRHIEGLLFVIIQPRSRSVTSRLMESLDWPGDGGIAGDDGGWTGVLWAGVFLGGGIVDDGVTGVVDISSAELLAFLLLTWHRSRLGSKTIRPRITLNLVPASVSNIIQYVPFDI